MEELEEVKKRKYLGYSGKEQKSRETHTAKDKESGGGNEKNVAHWRKII